MSLRKTAAFFTALLLVAAAACQRTPAPKRYQLTGQVVAVDTARGQITIDHQDIPDFMPAMTMPYLVANPALLQGRTPGELITGVLEVENSTPRLVEITHLGSAPLPASATASAAATGILDVGDHVPDTALIDQANRRRSLSEWAGTAVLITFIYTRCPLPNFCPLMDQNFATIQRRLADDTILHGHVHLITITFDPEHDTPAVLAEHAKKLEADPAVWTFLTGDPVTVERFGAKFGINVLRDPKEPAQVTHNLRTALIGPDQRVVKIYSGNDWTPGTVLADLRDLVGKAK